MNSQQRSAIREMTRTAREMNLTVMQGVVSNSAESIRIGHQDLLAWLAAHEGEEIIVMLGPVESDANGGISAEPKVCRKCGRDYRGRECDHCNRQRIRIRGS